MSGSVCVHTCVDLPVSLQGFLCLELGTTLVTNYGLLTSWRQETREWELIIIFTHVPHLEK